MPKYPRNSTLSCSFCSKTQQQEIKIITGPSGVYICSDCIKLCLDIIHESSDGSKRVSWGNNTVPPPKKIKEHLDQYVIGQTEAKKRLSVAVYNHYRRLENVEDVEQNKEDVEIQKSNLLLIGPTGTGKTLMAQTLAKFLNVPFVIADATTLTEAGYVGEDVENIILNLYRSAENKIDQTIRGIVFIDEVDKLAKRGSAASVSRDVSGEGVQQALLKIVEGTMASIQMRENKRLSSQQNIQIDTSNILFICGGSFEGLDKIIDQRTGKGSIGFSSDDPVKIEDHRQKTLADVTPEDLEKFGLIPEFIGRLPVIAVMENLNKEQLVRILKEPKNSLIKQYQKLFKEEKVGLQFTDQALKAIALKATERKAGARGLRTIIESVMLDIMYEMPSETDLLEVIVEEETITEGKSPKTKYSDTVGVPS
jgi:ATP-dependent Clp protease ATP-binding subunit ClpX